MQLPHRFGKYILVSKIAQGGMAEIYRAKYLGEGGFVKDVAVKRILPLWSDNKEFVTMLCDEARALVHLQHQNIVQIYELGKDGDIFYISMEFVEGVDLRRLFKKVANPPTPPLIKGGQGFDLPPKFTCFIVAEILKALDFAHNRIDKQGRPLGIIHRDISPQNILISYNGEVKTVDFGIAKGAHRSFETTVAQVKGKYAYMSPEQAEGKTVDVRTDLYATGVILYELLTKKRLYDAPNDLLTIEEVKKSILPGGWENGVPMGIRPIVRRALQRDLEKRYQSAEEFLSDINKFVFANKLVTHGLELSVYLRELFREEYERSLKEEDVSIEDIKEEKRPQTRILSIISKTSPEKQVRWLSAIKRYRWYAMAALLLVFGLMFAISKPTMFSGGDAGKLESPVTASATSAQVAPPMPVIPNVPASKIAPPANPPEPPVLPKSAGTAKPSVASVLNSPSAFGTLSVQARPWGYVYVPGHVSKKETPVRGIKLKPGEYLVKVHYEPEDKWAQQKIIVAENSNTTCVATFTDKSSLTCKSIR